MEVASPKTVGADAPPSPALVARRDGVLALNRYLLPPSDFARHPPTALSFSRARLSLDGRTSRTRTSCRE